MPHWLADRAPPEGIVRHIQRFDPRFWVVNFPRPMMASVVTTGGDSLRVDATFLRRGDLAGLIWEASDARDHVLLRYATARDFRGCRLRFRWRSGGVRGLDAVGGPTLTIEGRDASGAARAWYVRLWNYAEGVADDALVSLDFAALDGGFVLPGEADRVFAGDIDRMFVSIVAPGYEAGSVAPFATATDGWVELSEIACDGPGAVLELAATVVPEHRLGIATGYDDCYHLTPARVLLNALHLGYRGSINHYVGMSHYFRLAAAGDGFVAGGTGAVLNAPCVAWHRDFAARAKALGYRLIWSLSYELLDQHCPEAWKQRTWDGSAALTGWVPPSTLLSPANAEAMAWLRAVAVAFAGLAVEAGIDVRFQVGEPWWWVTADGRPCLYDDAARAALGDPGEIATVRGNLGAGARAVLDAAGVLLAASTAALSGAVRNAAPGAETLLLAYLPSVLDPAAPEVRRMNLPLGWARPAFDVLQLEDYDWAATGNRAASDRAVAEASARLSYPASEQHYLAGFVLNAAQRGQWAAIDTAAERARVRGVAETFVWALPQVMRDGFVHFDEEGDVQGFDDVSFPLALGREAEVMPETSTAIVASAGGHESRNAGWAEARTRYDVGPGVRSEADIAALLSFFRARMGPARGFRLRDPFDAAGSEELLGVGDGVVQRFALVRRYGEVARRITRPVAGSVRLFVGGVETGAFAVEDGGWVTLDAAPAAGVTVRASFAFDVPVRFAEDRLSVSRATFAAGAAASVPLVEVREG